MERRPLLHLQLQLGAASFVGTRAWQLWLASVQAESSVTISM